MRPGSAPRSFRPPDRLRAGWPTVLDDVREGRRVAIAFAAVLPAARPSVLAVVRRVLVDGLPVLETVEWSVECRDGPQAVERRAWLAARPGRVRDACVFADAFGGTDREMRLLLEHADEAGDRKRGPSPDGG